MKGCQPLTRYLGEHPMANTLIFQAPEVGTDDGSEEVSLVEVLKAVVAASLTLNDDDFATAIAGLEKISGLPGGGISIRWRNAKIAATIGVRFSQALFAALDLRR
jgi:hypothetical protein